MGRSVRKSWLVEQYRPGLTADVFRSTTNSVRRTAAAMARAGTPIRYRHSTLVPEDEAAYSVIDAATPALVEELYARAGVRFDRILTALEG
jgi:hypothetical protein